MQSLLTSLTTQQRYAEFLNVFPSGRSLNVDRATLNHALPVSFIFYFVLQLPVRQYPGTRKLTLSLRSVIVDEELG